MNATPLNHKEVFLYDYLIKVPKNEMKNVAECFEWPLLELLRNQNAFLNNTI